MIASCVDDLGMVTNVTEFIINYHELGALRVDRFTRLPRSRVLEEQEDKRILVIDQISPRYQM